MIKPRTKNPALEGLCSFAGTTVSQEVKVVTDETNNGIITADSREIFPTFSIAREKPPLSLAGTTESHIYVKTA